jgi:hypothetical protein
MKTPRETIRRGITIAVTVLVIVAGVGSGHALPADGCFGPWHDAGDYSYCTAKRMENDAEKGEPVGAADPRAYYVRCHRGQAAGYVVYVTGGSPRAAARRRAAVCDAESPLRGVEYPQELLNTLTR